MAHLGRCSVSNSTGWSQGLSPAGECPALQIALEEQGLGTQARLTRVGKLGKAAACSDLPEETSSHHV